MKEIKRNFLSLISLLLSLIMLFGCTVQGNAPETGDGKDDKPDADGTVIRIYDARGEGYGVAFSGLSSPITLSDGEIFKNGDLKPVWRELSEIAGVRIAPSESNEADIIIDTLGALTERAEDGELVDLSHLYSSMSMLREYMWANPEVRFAFAADDEGATFVAPTIGLCKRLARLPFVRTDWIELLLNGEGRFEAEECGTLGEIHYEPVMPTDEPLLVPTLSDSGLGVKLQKKNYARSGNIIEIMNYAAELSPVDGVTAVNMLRDYIDAAYDGAFGVNRADLFIGTRAIWDADELVALLRCAMANSYSLGCETGCCGLYSLDGGADLVSLAGMMFGARGLDTESMIYINEAGEMVDARISAETEYVLKKLSEIEKEGLISDGCGIVAYASAECPYRDGGADYSVMTVPVSYFSELNEDGECVKVLKRYSESAFDFAEYGVAISKSCAEDTDRLSAAKRLVDSFYGTRGKMLISTGGDAFSDEGIIADAEKFTDGNIAEYMRRYLGASLVGSLPMEVASLGNERFAAVMDAIENMRRQKVIEEPDVMLGLDSFALTLPPTLALTAGERRIALDLCPEYLHGELSGVGARRMMWTLMTEDEDPSSSMENICNLGGRETAMELYVNLWERHKAYYTKIFD